MNQTPNRNNYDIVIIGAGPAGLNASHHAKASAPNANILLLDKIVPWDRPIACAEGVGKLGFERCVTVDNSWIRLVVDTAVFHAPNQKCIKYVDKNKGYIIDRAKMQHDLGKQAQKKGVEVSLNQRVVKISPEENGIRKLQFSSGHEISAKVIIDASGPVSCFGKCEPIQWKPHDLEPAYFVVADNIQLNTNEVHIYSAQDIAPGGYAWVFPRSATSANIGIVLGRNCNPKVNIVHLLNTFLKTHFPDAHICNKFAGSIPCGYQRGPIAIPGLIKTGDAASTINPISRAGISEALLSGLLAGQAAGKMLGSSSIKEMKHVLKNYETQWYKERGMRHLKLARVKNSLKSIPDEDFNKAADALEGIPIEKMTMSQIFKLSLGRFPKLVWAMRHLM